MAYHSEKCYMKISLNFVYVCLKVIYMCYCNNVYFIKTSRKTDNEKDYD